MIGKRELYFIKTVNQPIYMGWKVAMKFNRERMRVSMQKYMNLGGDSGVEGFEIGKDYIKVKFFGNSKIYMYSYESAGKEKVEHMKQCALCGQGLNEYINRYARLDYVK